jgi:hypothetical protein
MPKDIHLFNHHMGVTKGTEVEEQGDQTVAVDVWEMIFTDRSNGDRIRIRFREEAHDELVKQLTSGVVLPGSSGFPTI